MPSSKVYLIESASDTKNRIAQALKENAIPVESFDSAEHMLSFNISNPSGCMLIGQKLSGRTGLEFFRESREKQWSTPAMIISDGDIDVGTCVSAFKCGVSDLLLCPVLSETLISSVRKCLEQDAISRSVTSRKHAVLKALRSLTKTEQKVLRQLVAGAEMKKMAAEFGTSFQAVSRLRKQIFTKFELAGFVLSGDVALFRCIFESGLEGHSDN